MSPPTADANPVRGRRIAAVLAIGVALALALIAIGMRSQAHVPGGLEGQVAPAFTLPVVTLKPRPIPVMYAVPGTHPRPRLVHFWGPSCAPCLEELPIIERLFRQGSDGDAGWEVVTITGDDTGDVREFLRTEQTTFPVLQDADGAAHEAWRISSIPASYVIRRDNVIHRELSGKQSYENLVEALKAADLAAPATKT